MSQGFTYPPKVGNGGRNGNGTGAELDRLVEDELAALLAERRSSNEPAAATADPAQRFLEDAAAFLAQRDDRAELLTRLRAMVLDPGKEATAPTAPDAKSE